MTANLNDLALAYAILSGADAEDPFSKNQPPVHFDGLMNKDVKGLRIGVFKEHFENASPEIVKSVRAAVKVLEQKGAVIVNIDIPYLHIMAKAQTLIITGEIAGALRKDMKNHFYDYSPEMHIVFGLTSIYSSHDLIAAQRIRAYFTKFMSNIYKKVDVMITPTTSYTAFKIPNDIASHGESDATSTGKMMTFAPLANLIGYPSMTIPVGYDSEGMPIGLQVEADMWQENILLKIANILDQNVTSQIRKKPQVFANVL